MSAISDVFVRDVTEVLSFPGGVRERLISGPWGQSTHHRPISDILDERLTPLRIIYTPEYTNMVAHPVSCTTKASEIEPPNIDPVPISRESAEPVRESKSDEDVANVNPGDALRAALPWSSNGKLVGRRYYGDYCINPLKKPDVTIVSPDEVVLEPVAGSCVIL